MELTSKQRFIKALKREKITGHVPHFELVFFLTMEAFGKIHPSHRSYYQWNQMSKNEQNLHLNEMADLYIETAKRYNHDAIFVHQNPGDLENLKRILNLIREKSGDEYYLTIHGDTTHAMPSGDNMIEFTTAMYENPEILHDQTKKHMENAFNLANELQNTNLLDGFTLCSDYSFNVNPFFTPEMFNEFVTPYLKETIDTYRKMGFYTIKHTDGNINPILDQIVECKPDGLHSIDPQGHMDLKEVRAKYGDVICTIGNVNCGLLQTGTQQEAITEIKRSLNDGMNDGKYGFIFSTSNCVYTGLPLERYELMHSIWKKEGIYR